MKSIRLLVLATACLLGVPALAAGRERTISREDLLDKIRGAWAGQMIGVSYGAATEFRSNSKIFEDPIKPEPISNAINQDDLYVEMTFARVMDTVGLKATMQDYGAAFRDSQYNLWHANASGRRNLNRGIQPPASGHPRYNLHADDIDFQIEADFIGIMCPGLPRTSNEFCNQVGHVMNYGDGVYGGMFVCGMYAAAYFETDPRAIVQAGLACLPPRSSYAALIRDTLEISEKFPGDWRLAWHLVERKWNKNDPCPDGALRPFNIDAKLNGAYIALGVLYGGGDFDKTMEISTRCGQDSDCNPSSAAGVIGAVIGYRAIPAKYRDAVQQIADQKFAYTDYSFNDIVQSTEKRAIELIRKSGGSVTDTQATVKLQKPRAARLEQCSFGVPYALVEAGDARWNWAGGWKVDGSMRVSETAGNEATLEFEGTGVALVGPLRQNGGRADVWIDGRKQQLLAEAWIPERTSDNDLWHINDLKPGKHSLKLVTRDDADPRSTGKRVAIGRAILYRASE